MLASRSAVSLKRTVSAALMSIKTNARTQTIKLVHAATVVILNEGIVIQIKNLISAGSTAHPLSGSDSAPGGGNCRVWNWRPPLPGPAKAPEGWRTPRRGAFAGTMVDAPASWSAAALRRCDRDAPFTKRPRLTCRSALPVWGRAALSVGRANLPVRPAPTLDFAASTRVAAASTDGNEASTAGNGAPTAGNEAPTAGNAASTGGIDPPLSDNFGSKSFKKMVLAGK